MPYNHNTIADKECQERLCEKKRKYKELSSVDPEKEPFVQMSLEFMCALSQVHFKGQRTKDLVWWIARKTWGWNKSNDMISSKQFAEALNYKNAKGKTSVRNAIRRFIDEAVDMNIIWREYGGSEATWYRINKYYDTWKCDINKEIIDKEMGREMNQGNDEVEEATIPDGNTNNGDSESGVDNIHSIAEGTPIDGKMVILDEIDRIENMKAPGDFVDDDYEFKTFESLKLSSDFREPIDVIVAHFNQKGIKKSDMYQFGIRYMSLLRKVIPEDDINKGNISGRTFEIRKLLAGGR